MLEPSALTSVRAIPFNFEAALVSLLSWWQPPHLLSLTLVDIPSQLKFSRF
ncbi:hypothetical protein CDL15_Pgr011764 [Punica granatum]|uniref:Uncharacterized protein n=1 Tax=Punica granatum TaxID=22663 RepID=A0A218XFG1_PUNGR|nr:hypothetical protein CDL15_Pgr011764 [Punica granatum]